MAALARPALVVLTALAAACALAEPMTTDLRTVAERSAFRATARHAEVVELMDAIAARSELARRLEMGRTHEGRTIPLIVFADPPVGSADDARRQAERDGKLVAFVFANIHAGEVCGKEALLMLARELATEPERPDLAALLDRLVIVFAPIYNGDGNERVAPDNRPGQVGPDEGMGQRPNAQGLDLNRDYVKLESPEARAMVRFLDEWDPHLVVDCHTTNGSHHRYHLTYAPPLNPSGPGAPLELVRDDMLPAVRHRLEARTGFRTFVYGNFDEARERWSTYSAHPRFGAQYHGLRGHLSILSEAYSYASYEERVLVTREFVRECLAYAAEHAATLAAAVATGRAEVRGGRPERVGVRHELAAAPERATLLGWVEEPGPDGRPAPTDVPHEYDVVLEDRFAPTLTVRRPRAYLVPPGLDAVLENLALHGIETMPASEWYRVRGEHAVDVEVEVIESVAWAERPFQGHRIARAETRSVPASRTISDEWTVVPTDQDLGTLAVYLLEARSEDGLLAWNFFDDHLAQGAELPILRVPR